MPTQTPTKNERVLAEAVPEIVRSQEDETLRKLAVQHLQRVRVFKRDLVIYLLVMAALTPIWIVTQYETSPGWLKHLSSRSRYPGDWDPWIIWVALIGAVIVAIAAYRAYVERTETEGEIQREIERLKTR